MMEDMNAISRHCNHGVVFYGGVGGPLGTCWDTCGLYGGPGGGEGGGRREGQVAGGAMSEDRAVWDNLAGLALPHRSLAGWSFHPTEVPLLVH